MIKILVHSFKSDDFGQTFAKNSTLDDFKRLSPRPFPTTLIISVKFPAYIKVDIFRALSLARTFITLDGVPLIAHWSCVLMLTVHLVKLSRLCPPFL